jgi:hypothetical protein
MAHIDYDRIASLDALIDVSDAAARASMIRLRERLAELDPDLDERLVMDGIHRKPAIAFYRGRDPLLHVFPEPGAGTGLHLSIPVRTWERREIDRERLADWLAEALTRSRTRHNVIWLEAKVLTPGRIDDLVELLRQRIDLMPRLH